MFKLTKVLGSIFLLLLLCRSAARAEQQYGDFIYTATSTEVTIYGYTGSGGVVTIPRTINDLPVKTIGPNLFYYNESITSVTIPDSVTSIGNQSFVYCSSLTSVTIPDSVTSIGDEAFSRCSSLTSVTIPDSVTSIGESAFAECSGLTSVNMGVGLVRISDQMFSGCHNLTSVTIPEGVTSIGRAAFSRCSSLTEVVIPEGVTSIGFWAFLDCDSLTSIVIPNSMTSIGTIAFESCDSLISVTIPSGVVSIGEGAFTDCIALRSIVVDLNNQNYSSLNGVLFNKNQTMLIQFPSGYPEYQYVIPNGVTDIGEYAFYRCRLLTSVIIPESVINIGRGAFVFCSGITSMEIPNSVSIIEEAAFYDCSSLTKIVIPDSVSYIGNGAFINCPKLLKIYIQGNAPNLGDAPFTFNSKANVYYIAGTTGWGVTYGGLYTATYSVPVFTRSPSNVIANIGENAAFSATVSSKSLSDPQYQWLKNGIPITGAQASTFQLNQVKAIDAGFYSVVVRNELGSVESGASLTILQNESYTQSQYEAALQVGINTGFQSGLTEGRSQVTQNPNAHGLYNLSQVQALHVGTPLLAKDSASGKFKLTVGVAKSTDLINFSPMPIEAGGATINADGKMEYQFTAPDNAAFYRLESR